MKRNPPKLNLFWRTFILLVVLLGGGTLAWLQTYRILELAPQNRAVAAQVAELLRVNATLLDLLPEENEKQVFKVLGNSQNVRFKTALSEDVIRPFKPQDAFGVALASAIASALDRPMILAESVNGIHGIWVRIHVQQNDIWLTLNDLRQSEPSDRTWLFWIGIAGIFSLAGAAAIAQLLNRPLTQIVDATASVQNGQFHQAQLDENVLIHEVSIVNRRFNEMTARLAKVEADRTLMLAGISHDLRTPLARIRLELELSVTDPLAREMIAQDIEQLNHIIDKFLDYARPLYKTLIALPIAPLIEQACQVFAHDPQLQLNLEMPPEPGPNAIVDAVELKRILSNLIENAARYGRFPEEFMSVVDVVLKLEDPWIVLTVRDHGPGVEASTLTRLTEPFYRGDTARSQANGSGLGLAIVDKTLKRMKGNIEFSNHPEGGLVATLKIRAA
jgi:two-component system osmolarity sensor histidine kinase EnvZ